jgi:hypothetical protein
MLVPSMWRVCALSQFLVLLFVGGCAKSDCTSGDKCPVGSVCMMDDTPNSKTNGENICVVFCLVDSNGSLLCPAGTSCTGLAMDPSCDHPNPLCNLSTSFCR